MAVEDTLIATIADFHNGERLGTACLSLLAIAYFTAASRSCRPRYILRYCAPLNLLMWSDLH